MTTAVWLTLEVRVIPSVRRQTRQTDSTCTSPLFQTYFVSPTPPPPSLTGPPKPDLSILSVYLWLGCSLYLAAYLYLRTAPPSRLSVLAGPFNGILQFAPRSVHLAIPPGTRLWLKLPGWAYIPLTHPLTRTQARARAVHMVPCFPPPALVPSGFHSDFIWS